MVTDIQDNLKDLYHYVDEDEDQSFSHVLEDISDDEENLEEELECFRDELDLDDNADDDYIPQPCVEDEEDDDDDECYLPVNHLPGFREPSPIHLPLNIHWHLL